MVREIELNHICKVEGHANLSVKIEKGIVKACELEAIEGARFFEALVLDKNVADIQEIVSRICGICSSSHSVAAIIALENALGIKPNESETIIRELLLIGERIRSHATHLYFLALPDYLNTSALMLADKHKDKIDDALKLIGTGNKIVEVFGGREMHPFIKFNSELKKLDELKREIGDNSAIPEKTIKLFSSLSYPKLERKTNFLCMKEKEHYAFLSGEIISDSGKIKTSDYSQHLKENIKEYMTSKFVLLDNESYLTGAIVRININFNFLDNKTKNIIKKYKIIIPFSNPFYNNLAQAIEISFCFSHALELIKKLEKISHSSKSEIKIKEGEGISALEAPRGTLFHEYHINKEGKIDYCNIITPTAQNLNQMEIDIKNYVQELLKKSISREKIIFEIEKLIRSYDPCFSCSTHFLKVDWNES